MPVRDGRWVSWDSIKAQEKAAKAVAAQDAPVEEQPGDAPVAVPSRRNTAAAEAAIADATGVQVTLGEQLLAAVDAIADANAKAQARADALARGRATAAANRAAKRAAEAAGSDAQ